MLLSNIITPIKFELLASTASVVEGDSFTITLNVEGRSVDDGITVGYTIDGVNDDDFSGAGMTGNFTLQNGTDSLNIEAAVNDDTMAFVLGDTGSGARTLRKYRINRDLTNPIFESSFLAAAGTYLGMFFRNNGSRLYLQDPVADQFREYGLIAAPSPEQWDLNTLGTVSPTNLTYPYGSFGAGSQNRQGMWISDDGTRLFQMDRDQKRISYNILSPAWDLRKEGTGVGTPTSSKDISADAQLPSDIFVRQGGTKAYVSSLANPGGILEYSGDAFFLSSWNLTHVLETPGIFPSDVFFDITGNRMYVSSDSPRVIQYYQLTTAWDLSTAQFVRSWDLSGDFNQIHSIFFFNPPTEIFRITLNETDSAGNSTKSPSVTVVIEDFMGGDIEFE